MGSSSSKANVPKVVSNTIASKKALIDENFGRQIMQNIQLKESSFTTNQQTQRKSIGLQKRMDLNKKQECTISWNELPLIFSEEVKMLKIDGEKVGEIRKCFTFPIQKEIIKK